MHFATSELGFYARPTAVGTVRVTASAPGYVPQTLTAKVTERDGATLDFTLIPIVQSNPQIHVEHPQSSGGDDETSSSSASSEDDAAGAEAEAEEAAAAAAAEAGAEAEADIRKSTLMHALAGAADDAPTPALVAGPVPSPPHG